jgi:hypothetical protein
MADSLFRPGHQLYEAEQKGNRFLWRSPGNGASKHCHRNAAFMRQLGARFLTLPDKSGVPS